MVAGAGGRAAGGLGFLPPLPGDVGRYKIQGVLVGTGPFPYLPRQC